MIAIYFVIFYGLLNIALLSNYVQLESGVCQATFGSIAGFITCIKAIYFDSD